MLPAIGSVSSLAGQGLSGVVLSARPIGEEKDGRQLVALKVREGGDRERGDDSRVSSPSSTRDGRTSPDGLIEPSRVDQASAASTAAARLPTDLTAPERADVTRLQQRDQQVRQEEKAHAAVAGDLAGPINYVFQRGPDGRQYAVGGSVGVQASVSSGDPAEAARKAGRLAVAANAATSPSLQDYAVARQAYALGSQLGQTPAAREESAGLRLTL